MEPLVWICPRVTSVSAKRDSLVCNVKRKYPTVSKELVQTEPCARTCPDPTTLSVSAEMVSRERTVMLQKTRAQRMETLATMEPYAEHFHKAGTPANVPKAGWEHIAKTTLTTAWNSPVFLEAIVLILSMTSNVTALEDSPGRDARKRWTCVPLILVSEECALISYSATNVFVNRVGQAPTVMSTLMTAPALPAKTKEPAWMKSMVTPVSVSRAILVRNASTQ